MNLPVEVIEAVKAGKCVVFLGNRATLEAAELTDGVFPEQKDLAKELGWKKPVVPGVKQKGVLPSVEQGAAAYEAAKGRAALLRLVRERVGGADLAPTAAHTAIVKRFPLVFTTNYDNLLERAGAAAGVPVDAVGRQSPIPASEAGRCTLVRMRGSLDQPETAVITAADYVRLPIPVDTKKQLRTLVRQQVVWFVGFRPDEEEFERLFGELSEAYGGELPRCHLAVAQGTIDDYQWQKWVWRGLLMFTADPVECFTELESHLR